jgi:alpha-tubulin suppressor-like RCC1 family protein
MPSARCLTALALAALTPLFACSASPPAPPDAAPAAKPSSPSQSPAKAACAAGTGDCDGDPTNGCEAPLDASSKHCGACGVTCAAGEACAAGACRRASALTAAESHACALLPSGQVRCWGSIGGSHFATGTVSATAARAPNVEGASAVRTGGSLACAALASGGLMCWAEGRSPVVIAGVSDAADVAIRGDSFCALRRTGEIACAKPRWDGGPVKLEVIPGITDAAAVASGVRHGCALRRSGEVFCFGDSEILAALGAPSSAKVAPTGIADATHIAVGAHHGCAVRKTGGVACWGDNSDGELGSGAPRDDRARAPVDVPGVTNAVEVAAGQAHSCALRRNGEVVCWGAPLMGGPNGRPVSGLRDAVHIAAGETFSCAARASGEVVCWGTASRGRLGNGAATERPTPVEVPGVEDATKVALGSAYSCALTRAGKVACWGKLALGGAAGAPPKFVNGIEGAVDLRARRSIADNPSATEARACALTKSGSAVCIYSGLRSAEIKGVGPFATAGVSAAVLRSGQAVLWSDGGGGFGAKPAAPSLIRIAGVTDAAQIAGGDSYACAVRRSGKVACVEYSLKRLFDKKKPTRMSPVEAVFGLDDAVQIDHDAGLATFCVARKGGRAMCWMMQPSGNPESEDKGMGIIDDELLAGVRGDVTEVAVGMGFGCALLASGEVECRGGNDEGQLGTGDFKRRSSNDRDRALVVGVKSAVQIAAGRSHACAVLKSGRVMCWGDNSSEQVGVSLTAFAAEPVAVVGL